MNKTKTDRHIVRIVDDGKQLSVRFPADVVSFFDINPNKDLFEWVIITEGGEASLLGGLIKKEENAEKKT